jgi:hypothetical protein
MNQPDDLEQLWKTQPVEAAVKGEDMRQVIVQKTEKFDRRIRRRNVREYAAAFVVALAFLFFARIIPDSLVRVGCVIVVAGALWIVYYLWRHGTGPVDPLPDQTLESYRRALIAKYDHQIRLLRTVKFWYLLPLYVGLTTANAGLLRMLSANHAPTLFVAINFVLATVFFGFVWWLNEVRAVRKIERLRAEVMSATDPEETTLVI